jgi:hypothetical protein
VPDTNVLVFALLCPAGGLGRLRIAWQAGVFVPLACTATVQELVRVLAYQKFRLDSAAEHELVADYRSWCAAHRQARPGRPRLLSWNGVFQPCWPPRINGHRRPTPGAAPVLCVRTHEGDTLAHLCEESVMSKNTRTVMAAHSKIAPCRQESAVKRYSESFHRAGGHT